MAAAQWSLNVTDRHVDADGTVVVTAEVTDAVTGQVGTMTWTLSADRVSTTTLDGLDLANFAAWSTR